jgi:hypothetical protein
VINIRNSSQQPVLDAILTSLSPASRPETILSHAGLWPSVGIENLLGQLSFHSRKGLPLHWIGTLTILAENLSAQQQKLRLDTFKQLRLDAEYRQEVKNCGSQGWDVLVYPDWLLIQLDANLLIRPVQASVAKEMITPESQTNTVMQLNMGDGKSSVSPIYLQLPIMLLIHFLGHRSDHFSRSGRWRATCSNLGLETSLRPNV